MTNNNDNPDKNVNPWKPVKRGFVRGAIWTAVILTVAWVVVVIATLYPTS